jgi:hypothetical protein
VVFTTEPSLTVGLLTTARQTKAPHTQEEVAGPVERVITDNFDVGRLDAERIRSASNRQFQKAIGRLT